MSEKTYRKVFGIILALLLLLTVVHVIYVVCAYREASIIRFIGEELW